MQSVQISNDIIAKCEELKAELTQWVEGGKKIAAKRARKATLDLEKQFKVFRKQSVIDTK